MQNTLQERDALAQADEADHNGDDDGQQANDFVQNTGHHISGDDASQGSGCSTFRFVTSLKKDSEKFINKVAETDNNEEEEKAGNQLYRIFSFLSAGEQLLEHFAVSQF